MILRPYQQKTVEAVRLSAVQKNKKILVVAPTGAGKSHIIGNIACSAVEKGHKVLALMHRRQLVTQLAGFFQDAGIDPALIMSGEESELEKDVQVATCQTYLRRMKLHPLEENHWFINASVIFIDEAHHVLSKTYQKILREYEDKIVIGVTATPILSSGVGMGTFFDSIVSEVTVQELIDQEFLVPAVYYGPSEPDLSKLKIVAGDYEKKGLNKLMNQPKLIGNVVENWMKLAGGLQTMVFAVKVDHSKGIRDEFVRHGINAEHLDAYASDEKREDVLTRFRNGDTQVLCNVGLYTEGTDIPEIECIVLARPTKSLGFHLQMVGRGARPSKGKERFLVLDHGGNINRLGFYEDEIEWGLEGKELGFKKKVVRKKEKKIRTCKMCAFLHTGPKCPQCGYTIPDFGKLIDAEEAELVALKKPPKATMDDKKRFFGMLEYHRRSKGYSPGWSSHKFREKFGVWPNTLKGTGPIPPDDTFNNYIRYLNIKWAKSKAKKDRKEELKEIRAKNPLFDLYGITA